MAHPLSFYESVVRSLGCTVREDGSLEYALYNKAITVGDKPLALPLDTIIRSAGFADRFQVFHPLCESDIRNPGPVLLMARTLARSRLRDVFSILLLELMKLAADKTRHASLSPEQAQFLTLLPEVNEKTVADVEAVIDAIGNGTAQLIDMHLRKGGLLKGETYKRSCIVSFPMLAPPEEGDTAAAKGNVLGGVTLSSKKSCKAILALIGYILPPLADGTADSFSAGSRSDDAPYFQALMFSFCRVMTELNKKVWKFRKHIPLHELLHSDLKWEDQLSELSEFRNAIPVIAGNDGEEPQVEEPAGAVGVAKAVATAPTRDSRLPDRKPEGAEERSDGRGISTLYRGNRPKVDPVTAELEKFQESVNNTLDHGYGSRRSSVDRSGYYRSTGGRPALNAVGEPPPPPEPHETRNSLREEEGRHRYYRDDRFRGEQPTRSAPRLARGDF